MITEQGTVKVKTAMDEKMQKELNSGANKFALVMLIVGAVGVGISLVLDIVSVFTEWDDSLIFVFLILFAVFLGLGIGLKILINKNLKAVRQSDKYNEYEFFNGHFIVNEYNNGENVGTAKVYNSQVIKSKETKNFLFFYVNVAAACPVDKNSLTETELNTLRGIFRLPVKGETLGLCAEQAYKNNSSAEEDKNELS